MYIFPYFSCSRTCIYPTLLGTSPWSLDMSSSLPSSLVQFPYCALFSSLNQLSKSQLLEFYHTKFARRVRGNSSSMTKRELHIACVRRISHFFSLQIVLRIVCAKRDGIVLCATRFISPAPWPREDLKLRLFQRWDIYHTSEAARISTSPDPQIPVSPILSALSVGLCRHFHPYSTTCGMSPLICFPPEQCGNVGWSVGSDDGGCRTPQIGDHVGIAHVHQRYSKRKAHKVVEVRRVVPRLDDENALPPLKKAEQPQQA